MAQQSSGTWMHGMLRRERKCDFNMLQRVHISNSVRVYSKEHVSNFITSYYPSFYAQ
jgi:hypothetical protein